MTITKTSNPKYPLSKRTKKLLAHPLPTPIIEIKASKMCPVVTLIPKRRDKVNGRIRLLTSSICDKKTPRAKGTDWGVNAEKYFMKPFLLFDNFMLSHTQTEIGSITIMCEVHPKE
jgi:hypothetical protein